MADNTTLNAGTGGDVIATDDVSGVKYQIVKLATGLADTATLVSGSNPLPVGDNGGSITVDNGGTFAVQAAATLAAETTKVIGTVNLSAAQTLATVTTVGTVTAVTNVATIGTSVTPGTGATHLGKAEDAVHADGDTGVMALAVRRDANTTLAGATGDYAPFQVDASGNLKVAIISGAGSGGTALTDAAAFTRASTSVTPIAGVVETAAPTLTNGNAGAISLTTGGAIRVDVTSGGVPGFAEDVAHTSGDVGVMILGVRNDAGTTLAGTTGDYIPLSMDSSGAIRVVGSSGTTQYVEDVASAGGESLVLCGGVRQDTIASSTSADGDYGNIKINSVGRVYTSATIDAALPTGANAIGKLAANTGVTIGAVEIAATQTLATVTTVSTVTNVATIGTSVTPGTSAAHLGKAEDAAHASGDTGVMVLAVRQDTQATLASATGDYVPFTSDAVGSLYVRNANEVADDSAFTVGTTRVNPTGLLADETATDSVDEGDIGLPRMTLDRKAITASLAHSAGGATAVSTVSAASTNATSLKASAGQVYSVTASSVNAAVRYLKFYNKASAPTVGTDTPVYVLPIPGNTAGAGITHSFPVGLEFPTGIAWALTSGATVADTGAVSASEHIISIGYK